MTILVEDQILDTLAAVPGVADVQAYGDRDKIFRIDIDQAKLASLGLTIADIRNALSSIAMDTPAGALHTNDQNMIVRATADVTTPEAFEALMIGDENRLGDVATVTLGPDIGQSTLRSDGKTGIGLGIIRQAESNTPRHFARRARRCRQHPEEPAGGHEHPRHQRRRRLRRRRRARGRDRARCCRCRSCSSSSTSSCSTWRATLIPALALPVALIGTIAAIYLVGFSVNILTLLALVLATGLVVDDAIVVLENIVRRRNEGMGPRAAAVLGTQEVFFAVIATTATLVAVFVPLSFLPGQTGGLFREFGFVLAMAVMLLLRRRAVALPDAGVAHAGGAYRRPSWRRDGQHRQQAGRLSTAAACMPASARR